MIAGSGISNLMKGGLAADERRVHSSWWANFGSSEMKRYAAAFAGGVIVLYGARLAGGCTSGHMISGMMQTALSGYIFAAGVFAAAIPNALMLYRKEA